MGRYIGIDLGGTNIKCGAADETGQVIHRLSVPTASKKGPDAVMQAMSTAAHEAAAGANWSMDSIDAIGMGVPGPIDFKSGVIIKAPNIAGLDHMPVRQRIMSATGRPVILENDANAAAFAEYWVGAAKDTNIRNIVMLTLGTGIGTGLIIDGVIMHGSFDNGAEGGHMIVRPGGRLCGCGQRGCIEAYASASHTADRAQEAIDAGGASSLADLPSPLDSKQVFDAAENGDELAISIINETAEMLGITCINLCRLLDPQMILFAGGMALAGDFLIDRIRSVFNTNRWSVVEDHVQIALAQVGNNAGWLGAAGVAWDAHQHARL